MSSMPSPVASFRPTPASIPPESEHYRLTYPPDLPVNYHPLNPIHFLLRAAQLYPDKLAIIHTDVPHPVAYSFAIWTQRVLNLAYALKSVGIAPGDRVAVISPNAPLIADAMQGVLAARAIVTPINYRLTKSEVDYILSHSGAKIILVDHEFAHLVQDAKVQVIVSHDTGRAGDLYEEFLAEGRRYSRERGWAGLDTESDENAPCALCYTSGTTGRPKGVITTLRGSYLAAVANVFEAQMNYDSVYLWLLPMFHACGWTFPWASVYAFATQVITRAVDYPIVWNHFLHSGVTHYCAAPTVEIGIVNAAEAHKLTRPIRAIIAGSAPTAHLISELEKKGITPVHVYGLTETYGPFTRSYEQESWMNLTTAERFKHIARQGHSFATALPIRVVNEDEKTGQLVDVPADGKTLGEIVMNGNIVMKEYYNDPAATKKAFSGGSFRSGDLAVMNPDGSVAIQDRSKDIIISGGENASSLAIEQELAEHPDVMEVSVVARPHARWGERPIAFVILHPEAAKKWKGKHTQFELELKKHAKSRLPGFACPEWVQVAEELPKTSTGKILKAHLRQRVAKL